MNDFEKKIFLYFYLDKIKIERKIKKLKKNYLIFKKIF